MPNIAAEPAPCVHVAVAVVRNGRGDVLLTQRRADAHQGGLWEFPGGKLEPGETLAQALRRELHEELAITVITHRALIEVVHDYGDKRVRLDVHEVVSFSGEATPCEGQPMRWVSPQRLGEFAFPAANVPIVTAIQNQY